MKPLAIDLFTGLHGWSAGLIAEGYEVVGFDIEDMSAQFGQPKPEHFHLVIQDVLTLHGSQFRNAALIVASPPCQEYSYMAMPWKLAKAKAKAIREDVTGEKLAALNRLFNQCFRIQREASLAAGRHIPLLIENVRGATPWVGRARWNFGSFYLWGDVPALMPPAAKAIKVTTMGAGWYPPDHPKHVRGLGFNTHAERGLKQAGISGPRANGKGDRWFQDGAAQHGSRSNARKMASAMIAKIPLPLAKWIGFTYHPKNETNSTRARREVS